MTGAQRPGRVVLVGAGPGDPGLLTRRGAEVLAGADVVVHDALVTGELLALARADARRIDVGKRGHAEHPISQEDICKLLVELARAGHQVVRLKGGDPFVFGRGGEEASACAAAGVAFEVVPGVSAALAAPALAGIPVSDRRHAASFAVVTGHKDPEGATQVRWAELARGPDTLVLLMALRNLDAIARTLIEHGRPADTPAAAVADASTPRQRVVTAPLARLAERVRAAGLRAPVTVVVGDVVRLGPALAFREELPLAGQRVLVPRAEGQAGGMLEALRQAGAEAVALPLIRIVACEDTAALDASLARLASYDGLVLTSVNAVRLLAARAAERGVRLDAPGLAVHCVGPATRDAAREAGLSPATLPTRRFDGEALLEALREAVPLAGRRYLLPRSASARDVLPDGLRAAGAEVDVIDLYRPEAAPVDAEALRRSLSEGRLDVLAFTSPSTVRHFLALLDAEARQAAAACTVGAIGPVTEAALREAGLPPQVVAPRAGAPALVEALAAYRAGTARPAGSEAARREERGGET